jgi:hypothetical protein
VFTKEEKLQNSWRDWLNSQSDFSHGTHWILHFDDYLQFGDSSLKKQQISNLMKKFLRRLDKKCYSKSRYRVNRLIYIESLISTSSPNHVHLCLQRPIHLTDQQFYSFVVQSHEETSKYHTIHFMRDRHQIQQILKTKRYKGFGSITNSKKIDNQFGLINYLKKDVEIREDSIDIDNNYLVRRDS